MGAIAAAAGPRADAAEAAFWATYARNIPTTDETRDTGAIPVAGGYALCVQGTWLDYALGIGRTRALRADDLGVLADFYRLRSLPPQVELHPAVAERDAGLLETAGYAPVSRWAVLERELAGEPAAAPEIAVESMTHRRSEWVELLVAAFADTAPHTALARLRRSIGLWAAASTVLVAARLDGRLAGGAGAGISGDTAMLLGAATLPAYRGRGVHAALIAARLAAAQERGATYAFAKTAPDGAAMRSMERGGFAHSYDRIRLRSA